MAPLKRSDDPYRILGVVRAADLDEIKAAHRRLAKLFHPDGGSGDEKRFLAVQEAYQLLCDPIRRLDWDRRHAPGPMRADRAARPSAWARNGTGRPGQRGAPGADAPAAGARMRDDDDGSPAPASRRQPRRPARDAAGRTRTWSAEHVPWWEDFTPRARRGNGQAPPEHASTPGADPATRAGAAGPGSASSGPEVDFDVFSRSSGAAWSMAARRHFRQGDADLPSRGAWRYRGTQVVTGAEARKVAAEEAAADSAERANQGRVRSDAPDAPRRSWRGRGRRRAAGPAGDPS